MIRNFPKVPRSPSKEGLANKGRYFSIWCAGSPLPESARAFCKILLGVCNSLIKFSSMGFMCLRNSSFSLSKRLDSNLFRQILQDSIWRASFSKSMPGKSPVANKFNSGTVGQSEDARFISGRVTSLSVRTGVMSDCVFLIFTTLLIDASALEFHEKCFILHNRQQFRATCAKSGNELLLLCWL